MSKGNETTDGGSPSETINKRSTSPLYKRHDAIDKRHTCSHENTQKLYDEQSENKHTNVYSKHNYLRESHKSSREKTRKCKRNCVFSDRKFSRKRSSSSKENCAHDLNKNDLTTRTSESGESYSTKNELLSPKFERSKRKRIFSGSHTDSSGDDVRSDKRTKFTFERESRTSERVHLEEEKGKESS